MKKSIIIAAALAITSASTFAQGFVSWAGGSKGIWNTYTQGPTTSSLTTGIDVALLFFTSSPTDFLGQNGTSTNNGVSSYTTAAAWAAISGASSAIVVDGAPSLSSTPAVAATTGAGSFIYNSSAAWNSANVTGGTTYFGIEVAWDTQGGTITTLAQAEAAAGFVGWSQVFSYTPTTSSGTATVLGLSKEGNFGVGGTATPEPGTMALAALGGASLLMFRRKK